MDALTFLSGLFCGVILTAAAMPRRRHAEQSASVSDVVTNGDITVRVGSRPGEWSSVEIFDGDERTRQDINGGEEP